MAEFYVAPSRSPPSPRSSEPEFTAAHGRSATAVEDMRLHQTATILTRPDKTKHNLAELTEQWRGRAAGHVPEDEQVAWVSSLSNRNDLPLLQSRRPRRADPRRCRRGVR